MNTYHLKERIAQLHEEIGEKTVEVTNNIRELQSKCPHPVIRIIESKAEYGTFSDIMSTRLCLDCGLQDKGYLYHYLGVPHNQSDQIRKVERDKLYEYRRALLGSTRVGIDEDDKPNKQ